MNKPPIIIGINGIMTRQSVASWPDHFDAWCEREGVAAKVLKKEYLAVLLPPPLVNASILFNIWIRNRILARGIADEIELLCGDTERDIHFVAHSNGTDIALKAARILAARERPVKTLIVVGSVLRPDIRRNGVLDLMRAEDLERAICYCSRSDGALRFGRHTFGYSELGRRGWLLDGKPVNEVVADAPSLHTHDDEIAGCCWSRRFDEYGHGTYFDQDHREQTFALIRKDLGL